MTPTEREARKLVRQASNEAIVRVYREVVFGPAHRVETVMLQRWVGMCVHGELFRRGVDPAILIMDHNPR